MCRNFKLLQIYYPVGFSNFWIEMYMRIVKEIFNNTFFRLSNTIACQPKYVTFSKIHDSVTFHDYY